MIQPLKFISLFICLLAFISTVNAWKPPQKPEKLTPENDGSLQTTFQYLSTKLRDSISPNRARREARYGPNIPPAGHHLLNLERRQANNSSTSSSTPPNSSSTRPSTSPSSTLPSSTQTTTTPTDTLTSTSPSESPSSSTMLIPTTLSDGSLSTFTSVVVVVPSRTTGTTSRPSSTSQNPSLQGGAASATIGLKKQMLAMLGGAVAVAMAL